jgi:hypothetical protein
VSSASGDGFEPQSAAVEEAAFPVSVQRIIRRIKIEGDLCRWAPIRLQEHRDKQRLDRRRIMALPGRSSTATGREVAVS